MTNNIVTASMNSPWKLFSWAAPLIQNKKKTFLLTYYFIQAVYANDV